MPSRMASSSPKLLLDLPYELRQRVLSKALKQKGTIEIQQPSWAGRDVFAQPLFQVCRMLRDEALQAFYETNCWLWVINLSDSYRSDPASYPSMRIDAGDRGGEVRHSDIGSLLTPSLPWTYPYLKKHLRRLNLNIYLPSNLVADTTASQIWLHDLPETLNRLVEVLEYGARILELNVLFTAKRINTRISLAGEQLKAVELLAKMRVKGKVRVQCRFDFKAMGASIEGLSLEKRMKA